MKMTLDVPLDVIEAQDKVVFIDNPGWGAPVVFDAVNCSQCGHIMKLAIPYPRDPRSRLSRAWSALQGRHWL